jgi:hypothetical protein
MLCPGAQARIIVESLADHPEVSIPCTGSMGSIAPGGRDPPSTCNGLARPSTAAQSRAAAMQEH